MDNTVPGYPDLRPHIRCAQCVRYIPADDAVSALFGVNNPDGLTVLCDECYGMQQR